MSTSTSTTMASSVSNTRIAALYRSRVTLLELLQRQGYEVDDYLNFSINDIHSMFLYNQMDMLVHRRSKIYKDEMESAFVKYQYDRPKEIDAVVEDLFFTEKHLLHSIHPAAAAAAAAATYEGTETLEVGSTTHASTYLRPRKDALIYVMFEEPSVTIATKIRNYYDKQNCFIVAINIARLQFNILNHAMVPPHTILTPEEMDVEVVQKYGLRNSSFDELKLKLPEISRFDAVALCIFMRPGQVCRIERTSCTAVSAIYYRVCV
jgi:DNA-directed RNA polymerase subunit H (RpoH/RPB5)